MIINVKDDSDNQKITISRSTPTPEEGKDGDIWVVIK